MTDSASFGDWVRHRRRLLGLTQADLAQRVACSKELIKKLEGGSRRPSLQIAQRLAECLELPPSEQAIFLQHARPDLHVPLATQHASTNAPGVAPPPMPLTPLIGRDQAVAAVCQLLRQPSVRLITLTGPGGIGKTRLSLHVLRELEADFADGAVFISLAAIRDPALVLPTIAQALGIKELRDLALTEALHAFVRAKQLLLVLDNFEQVVAAARSVAALLAAAPSLKVLVTSRAVLHLGGEHEFAVAPLALPNLQQPRTTAELQGAPAVALFVARAQAVRADFVLTDENAESIARICARLDGLPLAIELAAARIKILSTHALLARLNGQPLDLLTNGTQDLPDRQQTMRSTIDWSYTLLDAAQQMLFRRLAVFAGGCTLATASAICNLGSPDGEALEAIPDPRPALDQLTALVDHSLVQQGEGPDGEPRFYLLETLREYALERLAATDELGALRSRHAAHFVALAEAGESAFERAEQQQWLRWLETEHDNLRAALAWCIGAPCAELGLRLAGAIWQFWLIRGYVSEGRSWIAGLLALPTVAAPWARARALNGAGVLAWARNDFRQASALLTESETLFATVGDHHGRAWVLNHLGQNALVHQNFAAARTLIEASLVLFRAEGATWNTAWTLINLGIATWGQGQQPTAHAHFGESLRLFRAAGDQRGMAWALYHLGHSTGEAAAAHRLLSESLTLFRELNDAEGTAWLLERLGWIAIAQHDAAQAAAYFGESLARSRELGHQWWIAWGLVGFAAVLHMRQQPERAAELLGAAEAIFTAFDEPMELADWPSYDHVAAAIGAQLTPALFAAARSLGQRLSSEQAVATALALR